MNTHYKARHLAKLVKETDAGDYCPEGHEAFAAMRAGEKERTYILLDPLTKLDDAFLDLLGDDMYIVGEGGPCKPGLLNKHITYFRTYSL